MPDPIKNSNGNGNGADFTSAADCDLLEVKEEDTLPGKVSDSYRKWLEQKYGRPSVPPKGPEKES